RKSDQVDCGGVIEAGLPSVVIGGDATAPEADVPPWMLGAAWVGVLLGGAGLVATNGWAVALYSTAGGALVAKAPGDHVRALGGGERSARIGEVVGGYGAGGALLGAQAGGALTSVEPEPEIPMVVPPRPPIEPVPPFIQTREDVPSLDMVYSETEIRTAGGSE